MRQPLIAVTGDVRHFDNYTWHAAPQTYLEAAVGVARVTPLIVPAFTNRIDLEAILDHVDGVMATGSKTNVHPTNYDVAPTVAHEPYDEARDNTAIPLLRSAIERGVPVLAICRGFQELNVALGGSIATEIQEMAGKQDHRAAQFGRSEGALPHSPAGACESRHLPCRNHWRGTRRGQLASPSGH